ncbi:MAG: hypothetical protein CM15mV51_1110 [uncultured marine virus]|nr:MAG: hypothetical protein CM15mV51_1110 [uncultured marine virus]
MQILEKQLNARSNKIIEQLASQANKFYHLLILQQKILHLLMSFQSGWYKNYLYYIGLDSIGTYLKI